MATTDQLSALQRECRSAYVDPALMQYAVRLAAATRDPARQGLPDLAPYLSYGASPRACIHLIEAARALACLRGRDYVLPEDVTDLVPDVFRHRLVLSLQGSGRGDDGGPVDPPRHAGDTGPREAVGKPCQLRRTILRKSCCGWSGP